MLFLINMLLAIYLQFQYLGSFTILLFYINLEVAEICKAYFYT